MAILIVGGAGYIGSHMCLLLADAGKEVIILYNLSTGVRNSIKNSELHKKMRLNAQETMRTQYNVNDMVSRFRLLIELMNHNSNP